MTVPPDDDDLFPSWVSTVKVLRIVATIEFEFVIGCSFYLFFYPIGRPRRILSD